MSLSCFVVGMLFAWLLGLGTSVTRGQDYPNKPIRIVTGPVAGGGDFTSRQVAQGISGPLGQPVIVDNRANGFIAGDVVSKAPPDGYTVVVAGAALWISPLLQKMSYDVVKDFWPISLIERTVAVLVVHPSVPVKSIRAFPWIAHYRGLWRAWL